MGTKAQFIKVEPFGQRALPHLIYGTIALAIIGIGVYIFDYRPPMLLSNGRIDGAELLPGATTTVHWDQDWQRLCPGEVTRTIEKSDGWKDTSTPFKIEPPPVLGPVPRNVPLVLPNKIPPGPSIYYSTVSFYCNPFQRWIWPNIVRSPNIAFTVAERSGSGSSSEPRR